MNKRLFVLVIFSLLMSLTSCVQAGSVPAPQATPTPANAVMAATQFVSAFQPGSAIRFESLNINEGLSQSVVNDLIQDQFGFIWLGTQDGLNRYDGYTFKVYKPDPNDPASLSDGWVTALYEDRAGFLWVGTNQGGVNRYDPQTGKFTRFQHDENDPASLSKGMVMALYQDRAGTIWLGTRAGLNRFEAATSSFTRFQHDPNVSTSLSNDAVTCLFQDSSGNLWVGTAGGLNLFDPKDGRFRHFINDPDDPNSLSYDSIAALIEDQQANLWVGTDKGLNKFDPASKKFKRYEHDSPNSDGLVDNNINDLLVDETGNLWVGTDSGLDRFNAAAEKFVHYQHSPLMRYSLSNSSISALYEDREGLLWIGTWGGGVNKYNPGQKKFTLYEHDPQKPQTISENGVFAIYPDKSGAVWLGTMGGGLERFDPGMGAVTQKFLPDAKNPASLNSAIIWDIYRDTQGVLWIGTNAGLDQYDEQSGTFIHNTRVEENPDSISGDSVFTIYEDHANRLWIGTRRGLDRYDRASQKFIHYSQFDDPERKTPTNISKVLEDHAGNILWIATMGNGLYRWDGATNLFERFQHDPENPNSLANNIVTNLYQDEQGHLWLSTSGGLSKFDPDTLKFTNYSERQGLPNNFIYCTMPDADGNLWMSTNYGVSKFDPRTETFENYTANDGLQSNEFNQNACALASDGSIYFGGTFGLNRFRPDQIHIGTYLPPVVVTALTNAGKPFEAGSTVESKAEITLKWPENSFEFELAALSFSEPDKNRFAYKLEGFNDTWVDLGTKRDGRYTNLPGGTYLLRLKTANSNGLWNENGKTIRVTVIPPFWQTGWFIGLLGLTVIVTGVGGYRLRVNSIESQKRELEQQVQDRTQEIESLFEQTKQLVIIEERNRLARELHDSAKQKAFAALAQMGTARKLLQQDVKTARAHITEAENLVHDVIQELTFLIQEMYPRALQDKGLATMLREYVFDWENHTDTHVNIHIEGDRRLPVKIEQALYRIVQEAMANVARHSRAKQAEIKLVFGVDEVNVDVMDNGAGFSAQQKPKGVGLRSMCERAESLGGQVTIQSQPNQGTHIHARIPVQADLGE